MSKTVGNEMMFVHQVCARALDGRAADELTAMARLPLPHLPQRRQPVAFIRSQQVLQRKGFFC